MMMSGFFLPETREQWVGVSLGTALGFLFLWAIFLYVTGRLK